MSTFPFQWSTGVCPLRADLWTQIRLPALTYEDLGKGRNPQLAALEAGQPVRFTTGQLVSFYPRGDEHPSLPPDLNTAEAWTLTGDDTLTAAA